MKKLSKKSTTAQWIKFPDDEEIELLIRPFSLFNLNKTPTETTFTIQDMWEVFNYSLIDWKGLVGDDDKKLEVIEESKALIFDFDQSIVSFVVEQASKLRESILSVPEAKNLSTSQPGDTPKKEK
jgi:hypothetical protein